MKYVAVNIKSGGKIISAAYGLLYLDVKSEYNRVPYAELGFADGDIASQEYEISESADFEPGKEIEISVAYSDTQNQLPVFKGIVLKQSLQFNENGCILIIELSDEAGKMTAVRKSNVFEKVKDSALISKLISDSDLQAGSVDETKVEHEKIVQYAATDWDFMLSRAEANGLLISVKNGVISAKAPVLQGVATAKYKFGIDTIFDFELEADGSHQYKEISGTSWDPKNQKMTALVSAKDFSLTQGNFSGAKIGGAVGGNNNTLVSATVMQAGEVQAWANSKMMKSRLSMLKGRFKIPGNTAISVGSLVEISGVGKRFSGKTLVTGVHHAYSHEGWVTNIQFGLSADWFTSKQDVTYTKAAGLLPGVNGLQIGIVKKWEADPAKENRIKVTLPSINTNTDVWSRLATPSAGKNTGIFFQPEPGDEVILGFLNDDPRQPVILGSLYSSANPSPIAPAEKNPEKGIITKEGIKILLNDENKMLTIETSEKNTIIINDKDKTIEMKDANNNTVKLSSEGITLDSGKDIIIKSKGDIKMQASAKVEIKGSEIDIT